MTAKLWIALGLWSLAMFVVGGCAVAILMVRAACDWWDQP